ncbi:Canalicular multispecific organic anion transporter 1 [Homalodisca vitripennis]|nr:Canalicular multispecific organic anion transporter 1 [Homalodisca vitripennis]
MKNGQVAETGSYQQLVKSKGAFADFLLQYLEQTDEPDGKLGEIREDLLKDPSLQDKYTRAISVRSEESNKTNCLQRQISTTESNAAVMASSKISLSKDNCGKPIKVEKKKLMTVEEAKTGNVKLSVFLYYCKAIGILTATLTISSIILYQTFLVSTNLWLSRWSSDNSTVVNGTQDTSKTHLYLSVYAALGVGQAIFNMVSNLSLSLGCLFAAAWLHNTMLQRVLRAPMSYFDTTPLGRIINRFSKDIDTCDTMLSLNLSAFLGLTIQVIATVVVITYSTPAFITVIIPIFLFNFFLQVCIYSFY